MFKSNIRKGQSDGFSSYVSNQKLQFLTFFSSLKPLSYWCILNSVFSVVTIVTNSRQSGEIFINLFHVLFCSLTGQVVFFVLLLSRIINITNEQYLTASVTLFNDLILTIPRYILWELIFTSRWIWLCLNYISAVYSMIKLWSLSTFFSLELTPFIGMFFLINSGLSFIRYFGKNQNVFLLSSQKHIRHSSKVYMGENFYFENYFKFFRYIIRDSSEGNMLNAIIITGLSYIITLPLYAIWVTIPGVSKFLQLIIKLFTLDILVYRSINGVLLNVFLKYCLPFFIVSFYWYCIELQSSNFRSLVSSGIPEKILPQISSVNESKLPNEFIPTKGFIKFINNINKKIILRPKKKGVTLEKVIFSVNFFLFSLLAFPSFFTVLFFYIRNKFSNRKVYRKGFMGDNLVNIFEEWSEYEYKTLIVIERLQKQLENIFSTVVLLDSSIHTQFTSMESIDLQINIQSVLGLDRKFSPNLKIDNWFSESDTVDKVKENNHNIARGINDWWCCNILLSKNLNNPGVSNPSTEEAISPDWSVRSSVINQRNEIFVFLLNQMKSGSLQGATEDINNNVCLKKRNNQSKIMTQALFLMQEMALNTIDLCTLYIYCYHRFLAKGCVINGLRNEINLNHINQFISLSSEVRNQINCAVEIGVLSSPYIHPIFEQEIFRLFRSIDDSIELLTSTI